MQNINEEKHEHIIHHFDMRQEFERQEAVFNRIAELGMQGYVDTIADLKKAFELSPEKRVTCIDEGTPGGWIRDPGSGILHKKLENTLKIYSQAGIEVITTHEGCGAAGVYARRNNLSPEDADKYGMEFGQRLAEELGIEWIHIPKEEMTRPAGHHIARVAYYDTTGHFDCSNVSKLPIGFVVSRGYFKERYSIKCEKLATRIALGDHGFGERLIDEDHPFYIITVGDTEEKTETLKSELAELYEKFKGRVKIDGFTMPESE